MSDAFKYWVQGYILRHTNMEYAAGYGRFLFVLDPRDRIDPSTVPEIANEERMEIQSLKSLLRYVLSPIEKGFSIKRNQIDELIENFPESKRVIENNVVDGKLDSDLYFQLGYIYDSRVKTFNEVMLLLALCYQWPERGYPNRQIIDDFLVENELSPDISNLTVMEQVQARKIFPYAWLGKDIPVEWAIENTRVLNDLEHRLEEMGRIEDYNLIHEERLSSYNNYQYDEDDEDDVTAELRLQYDLFIQLMNDMPPLPRPIILFRSFFGKLPRENDEIVTEGFWGYDYIYPNESTNLIISYPANHKFIMLVDEHGFNGMISYPGEILKVIKVDGKDIYCNFVGYRSYNSPHGVNPPHTLTDDMTTLPPVFKLPTLFDLLMANSNMLTSRPSIASISSSSRSRLPPPPRPSIASSSSSPRLPPPPPRPSIASISSSSRSRLPPPPRPSIASSSSSSSPRLPPPPRPSIASSSSSSRPSRSRLPVPPRPYSSSSPRSPSSSSSLPPP